MKPCKSSALVARPLYRNYGTKAKSGFLHQKRNTSFTISNQFMVIAKNTPRFETACFHRERPQMKIQMLF